MTGLLFVAILALYFIAAYKLALAIVAYFGAARTIRPREVEDRVRERLGRLGERMVSAGFGQRLRRKLALAGQPKDLNPDGFMALKLLAATAGLVLALATGLVFRAAAGGLFLLVVAVTTGGFFLPDLWLERLIAKRQKSIKLDLPDVLDMLTISVEAGLGFDAALSKVVANGRGPLAREFFRVLQEIGLGSSRREAFHNLAGRTDVPELNSFILAMLQADVFGVSVGNVLRVQAKEMRVKRRQQAEEIAMKAPVKIVFPLVLCIFPALIVVILGPAGVRIYQSLFVAIGR